jgi:hypothetical protein
VSVRFSNPSRSVKNSSAASWSETVTITVPTAVILVLVWASAINSSLGRFPAT